VLPVFLLLRRYDALLKTVKVDELLHRPFSSKSLTATNAFVAKNQEDLWGNYR
jgi:hypothetical protein